MSVKKVEQTALSNNVNDCMHSSSNSVAFSSRSDSRVRRTPHPIAVFFLITCLCAVPTVGTPGAGYEFSYSVPKTTIVIVRLLYLVKGAPSVPEPEKNLGRNNTSN